MALFGKTNRFLSNRVVVISLRADRVFIFRNTEKNDGRNAELDHFIQFFAKAVD